MCTGAFTKSVSPISYTVLTEGAIYLSIYLSIYLYIGPIYIMSRCVRRCIITQFITLHFLCTCGSVVEHCVSSAKGRGFNSQGTHILIKKMYSLNAL